MDNRTKISDEHKELLVWLMEECAEVQLAISKCLRHGPDSYHPDDANMTPNDQEIAKEFGHVMGVFMRLVETDFFPEHYADVVEEAIEEKLNETDYLHGSLA